MSFAAETQLGPYKLIALIGAGGMGEVGGVGHGDEPSAVSPCGWGLLPSWTSKLVREAELHGYGGFYGRRLTIDDVGFVTPPAHGIHGGE
jgi:hypothetical protein